MKCCAPDKPLLSLKIFCNRYHPSILKPPLWVGVCDPFHAELQVDGFSGTQEDTDILRKIAVFGNFQHGIASCVHPCIQRRQTQNKPSQVDFGTRRIGQDDQSGFGR